ncbi:galanin receptor 2b-like [Asterias amurensis]|uniref:galanin receptor 2b-like n=1 Tax=Asterias amurensis TaxID=7602 RepID=UPI003AB2211E
MATVCIWIFLWLLLSFELSDETSVYHEAMTTTDASNFSLAIGSKSNNAVETAAFAISLMIAGLGLLGNGLIIILFCLNWNLTRTLTSLYIFHQSVIDFVSSMMFAALQLDRWRPLLSVGGWVEDLSCKVWYSKALFWSLLHISTINLVLVTIERYISVLHPIFRLNHFTRRKAKLTMLLAWLIGLTYQSYWMVISKGDQGQCYQEFPSDALQNVFGGLTLLVEYLIPLSIMSFAYVRIIARLKKLAKYGERRRRCSTTTMTPSKRRGSSFITEGVRCRSGPTQLMLVKARRNVTKTLCLVFATYVICWTPVEIEYIIYSVGISYHQNIGQSVTTCLLMGNMCVNPFIYAAKYRQIQMAAKRTWNKLLCRHTSNVPFPPSPSI